MTLREKLEEGLAHWNKEPGKACGNTIEDCEKNGCPYSGSDCTEQMLTDAYELLKGMKKPGKAKAPDGLTPEAVMGKVLELIQSLLVWEISDGESGNEAKTRSLYYIAGMTDLADELIKMMEGTK